MTLAVVIQMLDVLVLCYPESTRVSAKLDIMAFLVSLETVKVFLFYTNSNKNFKLQYLIANDY